MMPSLLKHELHFPQVERDIPVSTQIIHARMFFFVCFTLSTHLHAHLYFLLIKRHVQTKEKLLSTYFGRYSFICLLT